MFSSDTDDSILAAAFASGDRDAFTMLYERYIRRIYDFVYYRTHHRQTAEDITQQVFVSVLERIAAFNPGRGTFSAWLHGIARNAVIDHYRSHRVSLSIDDAWDLPDDTDVERDADTALRLREVRQVMRELTPKQREIVMLRLWHGYSFPEIAAIIGGTDDAAKMAFGRALKNIRSDLLPLVFLASFFLRP